MKITSIKSGISKVNETQVLESIDDENRHSLNLVKGWADGDLYVCDCNLIDNKEAKLIYNNSRHIYNIVGKGGVVLAFSGSNYTQSQGINNYSWIPGFEASNYKHKKISSKDFNFGGGWDFIKPLEKIKKQIGMDYGCIFKGSGSFRTIGKNKGGETVALYKKVFGDGHVFILPKPKDKKIFLERFISEILPELNLNFDLPLGDTSPTPQFIKQNRVYGEQSIIDNINNKEDEITKLKGEIDNLMEEKKGLKKWKQLLWQTGTPLEEIVEDFFGLLNLELDSSETDLIGEYNDKDVLIEVKGKTSCISHKEDFRQILERAVTKSDNPFDNYAVLVGNPYRKKPLDERPPESENLFAHTCVGLAENNDIGLVSTEELFDIVNYVFKNDPDEDKKKEILESILESNGIYKFDN